MSTNYTGDPTAVQSPASAPGAGVEPIVVLPIGTDGFSASAFYQAYKVLADYVAFLTNYSDLAPSIFGDGSDGAVTLGSNTTLTKPMYYDTLDLAGFTLDTKGYPVFVKTTLTTNNGIIQSNGSDGGSAPIGTAGGTAGTAGGGGLAGLSGFAGGAGGAASSNGSNGAGDATSSGYIGLGGAGGAGGSAVGTGGNGGNNGGAVTSYRGYARMSAPYLTGSLPPVGEIMSGGAGGGGGGGGATGTVKGGGGGGGGGGVVGVFARDVVLDLVAGVPCIRANGGAGGGGFVTGGGGGGGSVLLYCWHSTLVDAGTLASYCQASGGSSVSGVAGTAGSVQAIQVMP